MNAIQIKDGIYWVGALDWHLRNFHGYTTNRGATYNAYLIIDEKIALIDTVKAPFSRELLERISSIIDPSRIDYIISNHVEMDHSGRSAGLDGGLPERNGSYKRSQRSKRAHRPLRPSQLYGRKEQRYFESRKTQPLLCHHTDAPLAG